MDFRRPDWMTIMPVVTFYYPGREMQRGPVPTAAKTLISCRRGRPECVVQVKDIADPATCALMGLAYEHGVHVISGPPKTESGGSRNEIWLGGCREGLIYLARAAERSDAADMKRFSSAVLGEMIASHGSQKPISLRNLTLRFQERTYIMGILNVTPDSFYDGGKYLDTGYAVKKAFSMIREGADIVDIGGESTRPGAKPVKAEEELERVIPVIEKIRARSPVPISIDTRKSDVARAALNAGADMINDVSSLRYDARMAHVAADLDVPVVLMHMRGTPETMQKNPVYGNLVEEIKNELDSHIENAAASGISRDKILIDPGIGFGKTRADNFTIIRNLHRFAELGCPILIGVSRKSFIGWALDLPENKRLMGTAAAVAASILNGAQIVRVHDVGKMRDVARIADLICGASEPAS